MFVDRRVDLADDVGQDPRRDGKTRSAIAARSRVANAVDGVFTKEYRLIYIGCNFLSAAGVS